MSCPPAPKRTTAELHRAIAAAHLALAERQGERAEDALCAESDRMAAARQDGPLTGLSRLADGVLLARRAAGVPVGLEFAITRELARRRRAELLAGIDPVKAAQNRTARAKGDH